MATYKYNMAQTIGQCASPLSEAFFSKENINNIQIHLKNRVRCKTGYTIDAQSEQDLLIIMRALYALHAQNPTTSAAISAEVQRLNELVLADVVPMAVSNLAAYLGYVRDASTLPEPLARGINTSRRGTDVFSLFPDI
ncbi:hypothetical protein EBT31_08765 [bacterium]|nr:hypothetical protein [bacterium]